MCVIKFLQKYLLLLIRMTYLERYFSRTAMNLRTGYSVTLGRRIDCKTGEHRFSVFYLNSPFKCVHCFRKKLKMSLSIIQLKMQNLFQLNRVSLFSGLGAIHDPSHQFKQISVMSLTLSRFGRLTWIFLRLRVARGIREYRLSLPKVCLMNYYIRYPSIVRSQFYFFKQNR